MARMTKQAQTMIEQAIYLPMVLKILKRDLQIIETSELKLKRPYQDLIKDVFKKVERDLAAVLTYLQHEEITVNEVERDETFTMYCFTYKGQEERHNYFNPRLKKQTENLLTYYFFQKSPYSISPSTDSNPAQ
ncbi:hypothetical protein V7068_03730 [Bacillus sp. JJ634]